MEATGQYWNALHDELQRRGYICVVLNPIQTGNRSNKRIRKAKTDPLDSELIARTILAGDAQATLVPDESIYELRLLVRHRWRMIKVHGMILRYAIGLLDQVFPEYDRARSEFYEACKELIGKISTPLHRIRMRGAFRKALAEARKPMM